MELACLTLRKMFGKRHLVLLDRTPWIPMQIMVILSWKALRVRGWMGWMLEYLNQSMRYIDGFFYFICLIIRVLTLLLLFHYTWFSYYRQGGKLDIRNIGTHLVDLSLGEFDISTLQVISFSVMLLFNYGCVWRKLKILFVADSNCIV